MKSSKIISPKMHKSALDGKIITFDNGLRIVLDEMPHIRSSTIGVWIDAGTIDESETQNGIAHFLEHLVFKGAGSRNATQLAEDAEARGIYLNAATSYERTGFYARCLGDEAEFAFNLIADLVLAPHFDKKDFELEKNVVLHEINEAFDDAEDRAGVLNQAACFENQSLGRPILGTQESLAAISIDEVKTFHKNFLNPANIIVAFGGAFNEKHAIEMVSKRFGDLKIQSICEKPQAKATSALIFEARKNEQLQVVLSMRAPSARSDNLFASQVLGAVLGGGMASRLFQDLREKRGLVYGIEAWPEKFLSVGRLNIAAGTNAKSLNEFIKRTLAHIEDLALNGPNEAELARAKRTIETGLMLGLESSSSRISALVNQLYVFGKTIDLDETEKRIRGVNGEMVKEMAQFALNKDFRAASAVGVKGEEDLSRFLIW